MASRILFYIGMFQMQGRQRGSTELTGISREQNSLTDYIAAESGESLAGLFPSPLVPR